MNMRNVSVFSRFSDKRQVDAGYGSRYGVANDVGSKLMGIITHFTHRVYAQHILSNSLSRFAILLWNFTDFKTLSLHLCF